MTSPINGLHEDIGASSGVVMNFPG